MSSNLRVSDVSFREANAADCAAVAEVHVQSWRGSFAGIVPQGFLDRMSVEKRAKAFEENFSDAGYKIYVAEAARRGVVGFVDFGEPREGVGAFESELYAIYLLPEFQRKGIGARLFGSVVDSLVGEGKCSVCLRALEVSPYRPFYERLGGRVVGRRRREIDGVPFYELTYGWDDLC
jgi:ribosomal protein S18 acetylase RimI-like enzyme